jgi:two-component system nitrate/nitrite response regulator NarL
VKILIADDHTLFLDGVSAFLDTDPELSVETTSGLDEALALVGEGRYDLVILDYHMPGMNGLSGLARMIDSRDGAPVALMSGTVQRHVIDKSLELGAVGFLPKTMSGNSILRAIKFMATGERFVPLDIMQGSDDDDADSTFSRRESEVLRALAEGQSNKEIANTLNIQEATVKVHVKSIFRKLGAKNRTHAALLAREFMVL